MGLPVCLCFWISKKMRIGLLSSVHGDDLPVQPPGLRPLVARRLQLEQLIPQRLELLVFRPLPRLEQLDLVARDVRHLLQLLVLDLQGIFRHRQVLRNIY